MVLTHKEEDEDTNDDDNGMIKLKVCSDVVSEHEVDDGVGQESGNSNDLNDQPRDEEATPFFLASDVEPNVCFQSEDTDSDVRSAQYGSSTSILKYFFK